MDDYYYCNAINAILNGINMVMLYKVAEKQCYDDCLLQSKLKAVQRNIVRLSFGQALCMYFIFNNDPNYSAI